MEPNIQINVLAVLACVVACMPVGYAWFGPLFGKAWAKHMGMEDMPEPSGAQMGKSLGIFAFGNLLIAWVLAHSIEAWQPTTWGAEADQAAYIYALNAAIWTWLGFFLPLQMGRVAWEGRKWGLVGINASFDLVRLLICAFILAYWQ